MIFKVFDNNIDKWTAKIGIFGKSFNEIAIAINNAFESTIDNINDFDQNIGFFENLKNNLFSRNRDIQSQQISIPDLIDTTKASEYIEFIKNIDNGTIDGIETFQEWYDILSDGERWIAQYAQETQGQIRSIEGVIEANEAARSSAIAHNQSLQQQTLAARASSVALKGLALAGNMIAGIAIAQGISFAIKKIHDFANASETARENAKQYAQSISENLSSIGSSSKKLEGLNDELQALSKGVTATGQNISLSASEYDRYKEIISEISGIMPDLTTYFNAQGEKIGFVKGRITDLNAEYRDYIRLQAQEAVTGDENQQAIKDAIATYKAKDDKGFWGNVWSSFKSRWGFIGIDSLPSAKIAKGLEDIYNAPKEAVAKALEKGGSNTSSDEYKLSGILKKMLDTTPDEIREMTGEEFNVLQETIKANIDSLVTETESNLSNIKQILLNFVNSSEDFSGIGDADIRNNITTFISSLTTGVFDQLDINKDTAVADIRRFVNKIIAAMSDENGKFANAWEKLFKLDPDRLKTKEYTARVQKYISTLCGVLGIDDSGTQKEFAISLGFDLEGLQVSENAIKSKLDGLSDDIKSRVLKNLSATELQDAVNSDVIDWSSLVPHGFKGTADEIADKIIGNIRNAIKEKSSALENSGEQILSTLKESYKSASEDMENLASVFSESISGKGLTPDSVSTVTSIFSGLKGYNEERLLDKTANGIRLNTRELEKLKKEYDDKTAKEFYDDARDAYDAWQDALRNGQEQSVTDNLYNQYLQTAQLADQYVGLTSAYNKWQDALSTENEGSMYDSIYDNIKSVKDLYKKGLVGTDDFRSYVDLISPKDLTGAGTDEVVQAYQAGIGKIKRYFTEGQEGAKNFLKDVQEINSEWAHMNQDGSWEINFGAGGTNDKDVAKKLGIDVEAVQAILRKLSDYGFDIDLGSSFDSVTMLGQSADKAYNKLKKLGKIGKNTKIEFDTGDIAEVNAQIGHAEKLLGKFRDKNGNVNLNIEGAAEAQSVMVKLLTEKQELEKPAILTVNTDELSGKSASVITMLQKIQQDINTYDVQVAVGADTTEAEKTINKDIKAIKSNYSGELANINIKLANIDAARQELATLTADDIKVMVNAIVNHKEVDKYKKEKEEKTLKVNCEVNDTAVSAFMSKPLEKTIRIKTSVDSSGTDVKTGAGTEKASGGGKKKKSSSKKASADGTFNLLQSSLAAQGFANASGNISVPKDQTTLINELGEELVVRDGRWFTVKGGAQFTELKKGDIVFNHKQTQQLLENGKITSSDNRGKTALASGSVGPSNGYGRFYGSGSSSSKSKSSGKSKSSSKSKSSGSSKTKEDSKQIIDWLERAIEVTTDKIDLLKSKLENIFAVKKSNKVLKTQIKETGNLITSLGKKIKKYRKEAAGNKLSSKLKKEIRKGNIKGNHKELVQKYGEKTAGLIESYKESRSKYTGAQKKKKEAVNKKKSLQQEFDVNNGRAGKYFKKYNRQIKAGRKKAKKYKKKADSVKLSEKLKKQIRDGKIKGNRQQLEKTYGKPKAKKIQEYSTNYAKYQDAIKSKNKAVQKKEGLKQQVINSSTVKKRNASIGQQIKLTTELIKEYKKAEKTYAAKAKSVNLTEDLKKLVRNGKIKGSYKDLIKEYGEKTAEKIEEYKNYYDKYKEAKKSREEAKTQKRELKQQKQQNIIDDAQARIDKLNAQAENQGSAKEKNKYLQKSVKWIKESYDAQIKLAKLEKDSVKVAQLKAEKEKELRDLKIQQHENLQDEYDSYVSLYATEAENARTAKDKEAAIKNQIKSIKDSYKEQIKIANLEKNVALAEELKIKKKSEILGLNTQILQNYADEHNASATLAETQAKNAASAKEKNWFEREALESTIKEYKYLYQIAKLKGDIVEMNRLEAEIQNTANESAKAQMENISTEYQRKLDETDRKTKFINHQVSLAEARNGFIAAGMYEETIKSEKEHLEMLKQEKTALEENFKNVQVGSGQWYEMRDIIYSVDEAIQSTNESIAENTQKIREAKRGLEDLGRGVIDDIKSEADFYIKILSYKDMFDQDTGEITREGSATFALHAVNVSNGIAQNKIIQGQIEALDKDYMSGSGMAFNDYYERRKELTKLQQDYILGCYEEMDAIKDLCKEGYENQKDAMDDLINKYKKALDAEKNLRDYENKVKDKTTDIASIKKQIKALQGNTTEEARAKLQKLTVQLREAEKDLEDTEYDKYISDQQEILDNLLDEFEDFTDRQLADLEGLVEKVIKAMPSSASIVNNTLNEIADMWGIKLSEALDSSTLSGSYSTIAEQASETAAIADSIYRAITGNYAAIGDTLPSLSAGMQSMLLWLDTHNFTTDIEEAIKNIKDEQPEKYDGIPESKPNITDPDTGHTWDEDPYPNRAHKFNENLVNSATDLSGGKDSGITGLKQDILGNLHSSVTGTIDLSDRHKDSLTTLGSVVNNGSPTSSLSAAVEGNTKSQNKKSNLATNFITANAKKPGDEKKKSLSDDPLNKYIYSRTNKVLNNADSKELAKILGIDTKDSAWKTNAKKALKNIGYSEGGIAETLKTVPGRTGDDGWCVVQKGEAILNLPQTEMFKDLVNKLPELNRAMELIPAGVKAPSYNTVTNNDSNVSMGDMVFNIDGSKIRDLDSLKREIQHDMKFRNFMTDVVLGKVTGNNYAHMRY